MIIVYDVSGQSDYPPPHRDGAPGATAPLAPGARPVAEREESGFLVREPAAPVERCHHGYATAVCGPCFRGEDGPPAEWLMVWVSGYLGGYATGYDHGHEDGDREHGEQLAEALDPMRRAAAHGIDVALARGAWQQHQRRMGDAARSA